MQSKGAPVKMPGEPSGGEGVWEAALHLESLPVRLWSSWKVRSRGAGGGRGGGWEKPRQTLHPSGPAHGGPRLNWICEIMLVAEGFLEARLLARKFITLYTLCKELLSKQVWTVLGLSWCRGGRDDNAGSLGCS